MTTATLTVHQVAECLDALGPASAPSRWSDDIQLGDMVEYDGIDGSFHGWCVGRRDAREDCYPGREEVLIEYDDTTGAASWVPEDNCERIARGIIVR